MPLFSKRKSMFKKNEKVEEKNEFQPTDFLSEASSTGASRTPISILRTTSSSTDQQEAATGQRQLAFSCQLAHGSSTARISNFTTVKELYSRIAEEFNIPESSILFCTLNTHRIDMNSLLGAQMGLSDLIFAHVKGQPKEVDLVKSESTLGLTITDNGAGCVFIKKIKEGSICDRLKTVIKVGDHIEKINDNLVNGKRHFEVAKILQDTRIGSVLKFRLVEPLVYDFPFEPVRRNQAKNSDLKNGKKTLRFKPDGKAIIEDVDESMVKAIERINVLLDAYMGINDGDLSQQIWDLAQDKTNPSDFASAIDESELGSFNFSDEFIFDLWAAIGDVKAGRVVTQQILNDRL